MSRYPPPPPPTAPPPPSASFASIDKYLSIESTHFERDAEVERVMKCFPLDPISILSLPYKPFPTPADIKQAFRKRSLLVHPDKCRHEQAKDAFEKLKKAQTALEDESKITMLSELIDEAAYYAKKDVKLEKGEFPGGNEALTAAIRGHLKKVLIEEELRKRKQVKREAEIDGMMAERLEKEVNSLKRKKDTDKEWEASRDSRVTSWRSFVNKGGQKLAKKPLTPSSWDKHRPNIKR